MRYIIVDLEATCDESDFPPDRMETIEIGAVCLTTPVGQSSGEFAAFVRPVATRYLSAFCRDLTGITQADVDNAEPFYTAFPRFVAWCEGDAPFTLCSWGAYDQNQLRRDSERHGMTFPATFEKHINLKKKFAAQFGTRPLGMAAALRHLRIPLEGRHHRGIDDARNIAKIAAQMLPALENDHD
ncbi:MAG: exonuclease domain-containing protein [Akkermansiaceae bacterium]|nr:exonuclease domain-containing protein [Armatimonadota bacterium]